ncbi:conserved membrane protein, unknown function [Hepatocystis sp. ex Piliocolobus tephrosceles]|nr:conserved membrane protein, unknown function [Hepatocystis sp. ex Piliocolobus tephrosceles]
MDPSTVSNPNGRVVNNSNNGNNNTNENNRTPFFHKLLSIIVQMLIIHLVMYFISGGKERVVNKNDFTNPNNIIFKNSFENGDIFDVYIFLSKNQSLNFDYIKKHSKLIKTIEDARYVYKKFSKYEKFDYTFVLNDSWNNEKYLSVAVIPLYFYKKRNSLSLINSIIKEEYKENILIDNIALTVKMIPYESEENEKYNLIDGNPINRENKKKGKDKELKEVYHIKKRIDINIIHDLSKHRLVEFNTPHLKTWKINLQLNSYTPPIFLSDFWLIETDYHVLDDKLLKPKNDRVNYISVYDPYEITKKKKKKKYIYTQKEDGEQSYMEVADNYDLHIIEKNSDENKLLSIELNYSTCSFFYYMFIKQINTSVSLMEDKNKKFSIQSLTNTTTNKEINMMKKIIMTTNIYMLIFSAIFILLHTIFSFFAFKNDMQFWYNNESMEGLSALNVITTFVCDIILALYLYDSENTSWILLFEMFIGVALSAWKVTKAVHVSLSKTYPFILIKDKKDYTESMTKKYDKIAIKYVGITLVPCFIGYSIYALFYYKYKSWYSYIISVLAGTVYTFGFVMMTPQLYINYKLKSVEHLPWKALIYKSLNTFIDDIAFFLIDMPWMHKLSCFRDDIIFLCYIYQRCIYKADKNRYEVLNQSQAQNQEQRNNCIEGVCTNTNKSNPLQITESDKKND